MSLCKKELVAREPNDRQLPALLSCKKAALFGWISRKSAAR